MIRCESDGFPEPSYTIIHNGTEVSNETKHTILVVKSGDEGIYKCIARNELGNDSSYANLTVGKIQFLTFNEFSLSALYICTGQKHMCEEHGSENQYVMASSNI